MAKKKVEVVEETISIVEALKLLCAEKNLKEDIVVDAMSEAFKKAYIKYANEYPDINLRVEFNLNNNSIYMCRLKNVVAEIEDDVFETDPEEAFEETGVKYQVGDVVETPIDISNFKRAAVTLFKNVFKQKLREAEKQVIYDEFNDSEGTIIYGIVDATEDSHCNIRIGGKTNAYLKRSSMLPTDHFKIGDSVMVYIEKVDKTAPKVPISVSRTAPGFITRLMEKEIGEIADGTVEIKNVARQPGFRSKVAVYSKNPDIDPSGACIGIRGSRINRVLTQIGNEKIDVVNYKENPLLFVADALKPAQVIGAYFIDEANNQIRAIVADDQFSLAIGKDAQNVNLAVKLTGYKIDIKSLSDAEANNYEYQTIEDIKFIDDAKRKAPAPKVKEEVKPVETKVEEVKPVEIKVKEETVEEIKPVPTKKSTVNSFSDLEAALNEKTPANKEQKPFKKKYTKNNNDDEMVDDTPVKKDENKQSVTRMTPVYTEEELKDLDEALEQEAASKYEDVDDYDEYEDYYDEEN